MRTQHSDLTEERKHERELYYAIDDFCGRTSFEKQFFDAKTPLLQNPDENIDALIGADTNEEDWLDAADHAYEVGNYIFAAIEYCVAATIIYKNGSLNFQLFFQMAAECFELAGRRVDAAYCYVKAENNQAASNAYFQAAKSCVHLGAIYAKNYLRDLRTMRQVLFFKNSFPNAGNNVYVDKALHNDEATKYIARALSCLDVSIPWDTIRSLNSHQPIYQKIVPYIDAADAFELNCKR